MILKPILVFSLITSLKSFSQNKAFVPDDFRVPDSLVARDFKLKPLSPKYCELDYQAVMSSLDHLKGVFGPKSDWPNPKMTLEESRNSINEDHKFFLAKKGFSYSVLNSDETEVMGCVYVFPAWKGFDAEVVMWVSQKAYAHGFDPILFSTVEKWLKEQWPFKKIAYPGRRIKWEEWVKE